MGLACTWLRSRPVALAQMPVTAPLYSLGSAGMWLRAKSARWVWFEFRPMPTIGSSGRRVWVPDHLPRLDVAHAFALVQLPLHLNWSVPGRVFDLSSRADRARV